MIAAASSTVRVLVGTTDGPAEIISLHRESAIVRRSIICVGGKRAGIDRGYNEFVSRKTGVIERAFGSAVFRIDVSHPIDAGSSWQLGFFVAHALSMAHRLAVDDCKHDVVVWASGTVRNSDLSVGGIGYVTQKLNLSLDRLRAEALAGNRVFVVLPAANTPEIDAELQRSLEATGARLLEIENVGQLLRELALPPVTLEAAAADKIWSGSPFRGLQPFESEHREIYYGRGRAREEALERLRRTASRGVAFLLIHGRSGAGKSSLVRAGLVGDIHRSANAAWRQSIFTPLMDGSPLRSLGRAIISGIPELSSSSWDEDRLVQSLLANNADVINAVRKGLAATSAIRSYQLLLFVDQLDELLLWANESADDRARVDEREAFANTLLALCRTGVVWTISTLRSDLLALLEDSPALSRLAVDDRLYRAKDCPEMIVIPAGSFMMGSPVTEKGRFDNEDDGNGRQHKVTIATPFAVSKFDVTFSDWDACASVGGCAQVTDSGFGRGTKPVINVNWDDAQQYMAWFSKMTGQPYRLLTEAEWEYAARAGSTTAYYWGDEIGDGNANCASCGSQWDSRQTSPVGSFKPNAFGLYDMAGNVWQWVQDCLYDNYKRAPANGSPRIGGDCSRHMVRGGAWYGNPQSLRAASRVGGTTDDRNNVFGFRLGRTLTP